MANIPLPLVTTPTQMAMNALDFSQAANNINTYVGGVLASLATPFVSAATTAQNVLTAQATPGAQGPLGTLAVGNVIRFKAGGTNGGSVSTDTITLNFGSYSLAIAVTGTSANWWVEGNIVITGSATQAGEVHGVQGTTALAAVTNSSGAQSITAAFSISLQSTNSVASQLTVNYATIEIVR